MSLILRFSCIAALLCGSWAAQANGSEAPVYQRGRSGGWEEGSGQYDSSWGGKRYSGSHRGRGGGYRQQSSGQWFVRPYPYHFDYYRWRYSAPPATVETPDCPCATDAENSQY